MQGESVKAVRTMTLNNRDGARAQLIKENYVSPKMPYPKITTIGL